MIRAFIYNELPPGLHLININPFDPLFASFYASFLLSLFVAIPMAVRELWAFVSPGLYKHEKDMIKYAMLPALTLFASGAAFAYFIIVPFMMKFVLYYTRVLGVEPTLSLKAFVNTVVSLTMATGVAFEYPLVMGALTFLGVVGARTWRRNWEVGRARGVRDSVDNIARDHRRGDRDHDRDHTLRALLRRGGRRLHH